MTFLGPAMLSQMVRDHAELIQGADGVAVTLRWMEGGTLNETYNYYEGATEETLDTRAVIKTFFQEQIEHQGLADVMPGDAVMILRSDVSLKGKQDLTIETAAGKWRPLFDPPPAVIRFAAMLPEGEQMVQWVFCRYEKGAA